MESLRLVAPEFTEALEGGAILDPFGDGLEAERVRELDGRARDAHAAFRAEALCEDAIELHLRDREVVKLRERRQARAEVVERYADAHRAKLRQRLHDPVAVGDRERLGDLDHERPRIEAGERRVHEGGEFGIGEVAHRDVHGDA